MSEKNEAGLNGPDMQAVIAAWIIANDGCSDTDNICCLGKHGMFNGTACPMNFCGCVSQKSVARKAKEWLDKYHQRKATAAKKQEQKVKPEPVKSCGNCQNHTLPLSFSAVSQGWLVLCSKKGEHVHIDFTGCPEFEPKAESRRDENTRLREAVSSLKKENAELEKTNAHLREELVWQFEQLMLKIEWVVERNDRFNEKNRQACDRINDLETQNAKLREKLDAAIKEKDSANGRFFESLKESSGRIKDLEHKLSMRRRFHTT